MVYIYIFMLAELNELIDSFSRGTWNNLQGLSDSSESSADEMINSRGLKKTFSEKYSCGSAM